MIINSIISKAADKYTFLTYLESTGTQLINTEYVPQDTDIIEVDYTLTNLTRTTDQMIVAQKGSTDVSIGGLWVEIYGTPTRWYARFGSTGSSNVLYDSSQESGTFIIKKRSFSVNGTEIATPSFANMNTNPLTIFNQYTTSGTVPSIGASVRISEVRIRTLNENNNVNLIIHRYIPAKRLSDDEVGMYDIVGNAFYTNVGRGTFLYG